MALASNAATEGEIEGAGGQGPEHGLASCDSRERNREKSGGMEEATEVENEVAFLAWATANAVPIRTTNGSNPHSTDDGEGADDDADLEAIADAIGDARVVALSEGFHNCKEMMALHHRIIRYLIRHRGFNTIATESGLPESRAVFDYVRGKNGGDEKMSEEEWKSEVYRGGLNKMYGEWMEGRDLIEWMREYNRSHGNRLRYYGVDIGGFYDNWKAPLEQKVLDYLRLVDATYAENLSKQLRPYLSSVMARNARVNYTEKLTELERAQLAIILDEAVDRFDVKEADYIFRSNRDEFEWARQSAVSMQLAENYYRNYMARCEPQSSKYVGLNGREIAMHRNLQWILQRELSDGCEDAKVILINHVIHTKTETQYQDKMWGFLTPAGAMMRQSLGRENFFVVGMAYGGGEYWKDWQTPAFRQVASVPPGRDDGVERTLSKLGMDRLFLHWDTAPVKSGGPERSWLSSTRSLRENDYSIRMRPIEWNACIYIDKASPATPANACD